MLFDSPVFFLFLIIVVSVYWLLRTRRRQNVFLLIASYFFYGWWDWRFLGLIFASTLVDFACARGIARSTNGRKRKLLLAVSITVNLVFLGFFKYFNFFIDSAATALGALGLQVSVPVLRVLLPPGISFYTFQELAYIIDVYNGKIEPVESLVDYALFITLFPHLIAGPIQRPSHLLPQVQHARQVDWRKMSDGMMLILTGLFRKVVIADNCALVANSVFNGHFGTPNGPVLLLGAYAFAWQIYGDFSGYSDIARGSAQLMGFHFMVNFRQPYLSQSLQDFWRRWHISLSSWLRDYLYIALGGSRHGERKTYRNLFATMLLGGLWHGANWTFVIWGGLHGSMLAVNRFFQGHRSLGWANSENVHRTSIHQWLKRVAVFHFVCFAWIFFRAGSMSEALSLLHGARAWGWRGEYGSALIFLAIFSVPLFLIDLQLERSGGEYPFATAGVRRQVVFASLLTIAIAMLAGTESSAFIYFQF
jgi:D-alanyl-lipoteichoic acid acyltransferase DltB (MBOAT superfamily)